MAKTKVRDDWDRSHVRQQPVLREAIVQIPTETGVQVVPVYAENSLGGLLVDINGGIRWVPGDWEVKA